MKNGNKLSDMVYKNGTMTSEREELFACEGAKDGSTIQGLLTGLPSMQDKEFL